MITAVPLVGLVLGALGCGIAFALTRTDLPAVLIGAAVVAFLALATRGMHLDGLADTVDGLGSYGDPDRVRQIMRTGDVGPFGAAALALVVLIQSVAFGAFATLATTVLDAVFLAGAFFLTVVLFLVAMFSLPAPTSYPTRTSPGAGYLARGAPFRQAQIAVD